VKETQSQFKLPGVPQAKQGREVPQRWDWTEASVWTERMLATLERGIQGGKWFSLIDKVWKMENLQSALKRVVQNKGAAGVDGKKAEQYLLESPRRLEEVQEMLRKGQYIPQPVKRVWIPKLGSKELRPLGVPAVEDRVVQTAVRNVIEPVFENIFAEHSYGFRPQRGAKDALRRVDHLLDTGRVWVVDADLKGYFDSIPQDRMMDAVAEHIADRPLLELIQGFLRQGVMESGKGWQPTETGTPQGAVISPLLANIYLNPLDHLMAGKGREMVRYADDFVILCQSQEEANEVLEQLRRWVEGAGLTLHPVKTRIVNGSSKGGFDFLGYHFERGLRWPCQKSLDKFRETIRQKTERLRPGSMEEIHTDINRTLRGWLEYFKHSVRNVFEKEDKWIRGRLRTILRKRNKGRGIARRNDHQRWPNDYFADLGLISLALASSKASQSRKRPH
jgi:RNA-directed DNA polymerase